MEGSKPNPSDEARSDISKHQGGVKERLTAVSSKKSEEAKKWYMQSKRRFVRNVFENAVRSQESKDIRENKIDGEEDEGPLGVEGVTFPPGVEVRSKNKEYSEERVEENSEVQPHLDRKENTLFFFYKNK